MTSALVGRVAARSLLAVAAVAAVTWIAHSLIPVNAATAGFAYLLTLLIVASTLGFVEACIASVAATLTLNYFFLPPVGTLTIADPQNWVALFSFLVTSLIAGRLSDKAGQRAREAIERQQDVERLYTFSRAILLIGEIESFPKELTRKLVEIFGATAALLYDRRTEEIYRAGPAECSGLDDQLRDAALHGVSFSDAGENRLITAVRLGSEPIASLALQGLRMPDSVLQGIANLVAIGLERAATQDMARQMETARQSEQLRTALIDAMVHELKTPLTAIRAATTTLLANPSQALERRMELLTVANEEAEHLGKFIDDAVEMARLDTSPIEVHPEVSSLPELIGEVTASMKDDIGDRILEIDCERPPEIPLDRRLVKLALRQLLDNALKYSPPGSPVAIRVSGDYHLLTVDFTDHGAGIPAQEQRHVFERFYRSPSVRHQVPGTGLGLSIAYNIIQAHHGNLSVTSHPGETTFRMTLPVSQGGSPR